MDIEIILRQKYVKLVNLVVLHVLIQLQYALYVSLHTSSGMIMLAILLVQSLSLQTLLLELVINARQIAIIVHKILNVNSVLKDIS